MTSRRNMLKLASAAMLSSLAPTNVLADRFPNRPLTLVVPFKPGGGSDRWSRVLSSVTLDVLDQPMRIKNLPGSAAVKGWQHLLTQPADGHTIMISSPTPVIALKRASHPPISPRDVKVVCFLSAFNVVLFARPGRSWSTWEGVIEHAKSNPGTLRYGSTFSEMSGAALAFRGAGIDIQLVPYSSTSTAVTDLLGGKIDIAAATPSTVQSLMPDQMVPLLNATRRPLTDDMAESLGDLPHSIALGYNAIDYPRWVGVHPDTPDSLVANLSGNIGKMTELKSFKTLMSRLGEDVMFVLHLKAQLQYEKILDGIGLAVQAISA